MEPNKIVERTKGLNRDNATLFDIFRIAVETCDEPPSKRSRDLEWAHRHDDPDGVLIALCGYSLDSLKGFLDCD